MSQVKDKKTNVINWFIRFLKGIIIGAGTILPGVSGGALSAIFGLYEPIINFVSNIKVNFWENILYFIPFGLGGLFGVFTLAAPIDYGLSYYPVYVLWGFIGLIIGTLPYLYEQAGQKGRSKKHLKIMIVSTLVFLVILMFINYNLDVHFTPNTLSWLFAGGVFGSGLIIPGLSTSNFLIYINLYHPLIEAIREVNWKIIIPLIIGSIFSVVIFAKLMKKIIDKAYSSIFHLILGVVIASTIVIIPERELYKNLTILDYSLIFIIFISGIFFAYLIGSLEKRMK